MAKGTNAKLRSGLTIATLLVAVAVAIAAWRFWVPTPTDVTIRVGYLRIYSELPLFYAAENEFTKYGVKIKLVPFESSPDMAAALTANQIDAIGSIATSSALTVESRDPGRFEVFMVDSETPDNYLSSLVVAEDSTIKNVTDLSGKMIGSFPGPTAKVFAPLALAKLGLPQGNYRIVELPIGEHASVLSAKTVDAVVTYEPTATEMVLKFHARKLVPALIESEVINPWQAGVWVVSKDFAVQHHEATLKFVEAIYTALDEIRQDPATAKQALTKYTSIDLNVAVQTPSIPFTKVWEIDLKTLQTQADLLWRQKILSRRIDVSGLLMPADGINRDVQQ